MGQSHALRAGEFPVGGSAQPFRQHDRHGVGKTTVTPTAQTFTFDNVFFLSDGTQNPKEAPNSVPNVACSNGLMTLGARTVTVPPSQVFVGDDGPGNGGEAGMAVPANPIDLSAVTAALTSYLGLIARRQGSAQTVDLVKFSASSGNLTGGVFTDPSATNPASIDMTLSFGSQPSNGRLAGTLTDPNGTHTPVAMVVNLVGVGGVAPKFVIVGITTNTATNEPYQILLIQQ